LAVENLAVIIHGLVHLVEVAVLQIHHRRSIVSLRRVVIEHHVGSRSQQRFLSSSATEERARAFGVHLTRRTDAAGEVFVGIVEGRVLAALTIQRLKAPHRLAVVQ